MLFSQYIYKYNKYIGMRDQGAEAEAVTSVKVGLELNNLTVGNICSLYEDDIIQAIIMFEGLIKLEEIYCDW